MRLIYENHNIPIVRHQGVECTYVKMHTHLYWPKMLEGVQKYIASCDTCQRNKVSQLAKVELLQPLSIPTECWTHVLMDFITQLLLTRGKHNTIVVFVDMLSKMVHFIPTTTTATTPVTTYIFFDSIF